MTELRTFVVTGEEQGGTVKLVEAESYQKAATRAFAENLFNGAEKVRVIRTTGGAMFEKSLTAKRVK